MKRHADTGGRTTGKKKPIIDVIELDSDDSNERREVKKEEGEEQLAPALPNSEELQKRVEKLESMLKRACRIAREEQLRAERAENALDSKIGVKENEQKLREEIEKLKKENEQSKKENEQLKKRVDDLTNGGEEEHQAEEEEENKEGIPELARIVAQLENGNREVEQREDESGRPSEQMEMGEEEEEAEEDPFPVSNGSKKEMECPVCENHRSTSVNAIRKHLASAHSLTPKEAGIVFRCDCGHESGSNSHYVNSQCQILSFSIICERRVGVKCILCESRPSSVYSYSVHLRQRHSTNLMKAGIHLMCQSGCRLTSVGMARNHSEKCSGRKFTAEKN